MSYLLGIDGGGTKTVFLLTDEFGKKITQVEVGPTSLVAVGKQQAKKNLIEGFEKLAAVIQEPDYTIKMAVFGLASVDTKQEEDVAAKTFQPIMSEFNVEEFAVLNDAVLALVSGTDRDNAVVLISGTGSNCYGENESGQTAKTGGWDFLLSDEGSGYEIGRQILRAAVKSHDGRIKKSVLEAMVLEYFAAADIPDLKDKVYRPALDKTQTAAVSQLLFKALDKNDPAAKAIFEQAALELWSMVKTTADKLQLQNNNFDLVLGGSVAASPKMIRFMQQRLQEYNPQAELILPQKAPVYGALKLMLE